MTLFGSAFSDSKLNSSRNAFVADDGSDGVPVTPLHGIAIITDNAQLSPFDGNWQYKSSGSTSWTDIPVVSNEAPLILNSDSLLRFRPSAGFSGEVGSLEARLIDISFGDISDGILDNAAKNISGGAGALSQDIVSLMNYVRASEKAPTSSFFTTDRDIVLDSSGRIPQGELLGTFTAADPDTRREQH